jgi:hypothetical protein
MGTRFGLLGTGFRADKRYAAGFATISALGCLLSTPNAGQAQEPGRSFAPTLLDVQQLPRFRPVAKVGAFSSYDRTGGNDDGFSGKYSYLRKEGDGLVIAEVFGAGAITRIFTVQSLPDAPIEFYFDGEATPRLVLPIKEMFNGTRAPFVGGLVGHGAGGYYSYVPLEFAKSIKVVVRSSEMRFYMVNYAIYEPAVPVRTYKPGDSLQFPEVPADGARINSQHVLKAGDTITLFKTDKPGRIQSLRLGPAAAFAGLDRGIVLRIHWDGARHPAVNVPVGDFFGYSFGQPATRSLLLGTDKDWNYIRFPMPFERAARIELVSERSGDQPLQLSSELVVSSQGKKPDEGTLHAEWRRENPTIRGKPFTYLDAAGRGHMVAAVLQAQGSKLGDTFYFEGDEEAIIDDAVQIHGTGSEDAFNGGWYDVPGRWYGRISLPFSGCLDYNKALGRTGGYRLFLGDAYSFVRNLRYTIEHGGEGNDISTDHVGTTLYYLDRPEGKMAALPSMAERRVVEPNGFVLNFYPSPPPVAALMGASLKVTLHEASQSRVASFAMVKQPPANATVFDVGFGPPMMALTVDVPAAGKYAISADGLVGPSAAMLQLFADDELVGRAVDFYAVQPGKVEQQKLAELHLEAGQNFLYLIIPGRNARSTGLGVELISIRAERLPMR